MDTATGLLRSSYAATTAQLVRILALQATHIAVRRWVLPAEMGIWNWLEPVFLLLAALRDLGVPSHIIRLKPVPLGNLLALELGWGTSLGALVAIGAPLLARGFRHPGPEVVTGLRVMAVYLVLEGISAVALTGFEARLRIERTLPAELLRTATYCSVVLFASAHGHGFWSFVEAQIAAQLLFALELWRRGRHELGLHREPGTTPRLVRDSLPMGAVWLLVMAVTYVDYFVVGRLFEQSQLALYAFGYSYAFLIFRILKEPIARGLYPALVALGDDPEEQFRAYRLATVLFLAIEVPAAFFLASNSELLTRLLAGKAYLGAAPYLALLAFAPVVDPLARFGGEYLLARRLDRARILSLLLQLGGLVAGGLVFCHWLGSPFGMAWANFLPSGAPVVFWALWKGVDRRRLARLARELAGVYLVPVAPFGVAWWMTRDSELGRLAATLLAGLLVFAWNWRRHQSEFRDFFRRSEPA